MAGTMSCLVLAFIGLLGQSALAARHKHFRGAPNATTQNSSQRAVHYVLTTDCTAASLWMGHVHAALLDLVQPGQKLSWLVWDCTVDEQRPMFEKVAHADVRVRFFRKRSPRNPDSGEPMQDFQASSRPMMVHDWVKHFPGDLDEDEVVALVEPDQYMMAPMVFKHQLLVQSREDVEPTLDSRWGQLTDEVVPGRGAAQDAEVGVRWYDLREDELEHACPPWHGHKTGNCTALAVSEANIRYGSGPPWLLHSSDFRRHAPVWETLMVRLKSSSQSAWESEQSAYGFATAYLGIDSVLYKHYTVSNPDPSSSFEGWDRTEDLNRYDPCDAQQPPTPQSGLMPLFLHACGTYSAIGERGQEILFHKDHIPKDILECKAPLLKHPPRDLLKRFTDEGKDVTTIRNAWMVCSWANLINTALTAWKGKFCSQGTANLAPEFEVVPHADGFEFSEEDSTPSWGLPALFNKGGYGDTDPIQITGTPMTFTYAVES